jgi:PAS domain S-box-containing protein
LLTTCFAGETLNVGYGHIPPITYPDHNGRPAGFAVDVLNEAARREGIQLNWRRTGDSATIDKELMDGTLDFVPANMDTAERRNVFFVSTPWWFTELTLLARSDAGLSRDSGFDGKRIVLAAGVYRAIASERLAQAALFVPATQGRYGAAEAVCTGQADAAMMTHTDLHDILADRPEPCRDVRLEWVQTSAVAQLAIVANRNKEAAALRLRSRIDELTADGTLVEIAGRHPPVATESAIQLAHDLRSRYELHVMLICFISAVALIVVGGALLLRQRRTQTALRRSEARYRVFFENGATGAAQVNAESGAFVDVNEEFCRMTGRSREQLLSGLTFSAITHPDDRDSEAAAYEDLRKGRTQKYCLEKRYIRPDGGIVWVRVHVAGIRNGDGRLQLSLGVVQDITAAKEADLEREALIAEVSSQKALLEAVFEQMPAGVLIAEAPSGRIIRHNAETLTLAGHPPVQGDDPADLADPGVLFDGERELRASEHPVALALHNGETTRQRELLYRRSDGSVITIAVNAAPIRDEAGNIVAAVSTAHDISDKKDAEERLNARNAHLSILAEAAGRLLLSDDPNQYAGLLCQQLSSQLGLEVYFHYRVTGDGTMLRLESFGGMRPEDAESLRLIDLTRTLCGEVAASGEPRIVENGANSSDPSTQFVRSLGVQAYACFPLLHGATIVGTLSFGTRLRAQFTPDELHLLKTVADHVATAVERARLLRELEQKNRELERSNIDLEQFAYVVSHDLQEPLRAVASYSELLSRRYAGRLGEDGDDFVGYIRGGALRMQRMIRDILSYSRAGRSDRLDFQPVQMDHVVGWARGNLTAALRESGAELHCDPMPEVVGDFGQLGILMQNLIGNAIKYTNGQRPKIRVTARRDLREWTISVSDNGRGIDPADQQLIFRPFNRARSGAGTQGSGLGLAIAKKIVERHGGQIWVRSEPGGGAEFSFTLPAER